MTTPPIPQTLRELVHRRARGRCEYCQTQERVSGEVGEMDHILFHPRQQRWYEHFAWSQDGTRIIGLTPCGRATVEALQLNRMTVVAARGLWVIFGQHPLIP
jgi:hypothetical protein